LNKILALDNLNLAQNTSQVLDLMNTSVSKIYLTIGTGETLVELTIFHGTKINIFLFIVEVVGLNQPLVQ